MFCALALRIVAAGVEQEHGGTRWLPTTEPDSTAPETETAPRLELRLTLCIS